MTEWIDVNERLPKESDRIRVRLENGNEQMAYFYPDAINWISFYGFDTGHWWNTSDDKKLLKNVTHWKEV